MRKKTKNVTVVIYEASYHRARAYAAQHHMSLSSAIEFLLANLPFIARALRKIREEDPNYAFGRTHLAYQKRKN